MSLSQLIEVGNRGLLVCIPDVGPITLLGGYVVVSGMAIDPYLRVDLDDATARILAETVAGYRKHSIIDYEVGGLLGSLRITKPAHGATAAISLFGPRIPSRIMGQIDIYNITMRWLKQGLSQTIVNGLTLRQLTWYLVTWPTNKDRDRALARRNHFETPKVFSRVVEYGDRSATVLTHLPDPAAWWAEFETHNMPRDQQTNPIWQKWEGKEPPLPEE
ncbi:hypothetical protein HGA91_01885 [candidate division WWE3 bacterium]|nr:hypothetical protein [candidate division WWE3 bacterium]